MAVADNQPSAHKLWIFKKSIQVKMYISCLSIYLAPSKHLAMLGISADVCGSSHINHCSTLAAHNGVNIHLAFDG